MDKKVTLSLLNNYFYQTKLQVGLEDIKPFPEKHLIEIKLKLL